MSHRSRTQSPHGTYFYARSFIEAGFFSWPFLSSFAFGREARLFFGLSHASLCLFLSFLFVSFRCFFSSLSFFFFRARFLCFFLGYPFLSPLFFFAFFRPFFFLAPSSFSFPCPRGPVRMREASAACTPPRQNSISWVARTMIL